MFLSLKDGAAAAPTFAGSGSSPPAYRDREIREIEACRMPKDRGAISRKGAEPIRAFHDDAATVRKSE